MFYTIKTKGENTMKNNKKTNKLTRTVTTAIAAVMMLSTAASFSAFADSTDAVVHMNTYEAH